MWVCSWTEIGRWTLWLPGNTQHDHKDTQNNLNTSRYDNRVSTWLYKDRNWQKYTEEGYKGTQNDFKHTQNTKKQIKETQQDYTETTWLPRHRAWLQKDTSWLQIHNTTTKTPIMATREDILWWDTKWQHKNSVKTGLQRLCFLVFGCV